MQKCWNSLISIKQTFNNKTMEKLYVTQESEKKKGYVFSYIWVINTLIMVDVTISIIYRNFNFLLLVPLLWLVTSYIIAKKYIYLRNLVQIVNMSFLTLVIGLLVRNQEGSNQRIFIFGWNFGVINTVFSEGIIYWHFKSTAMFCSNLAFFFIFFEEIENQVLRSFLLIVTTILYTTHCYQSEKNQRSVFKEQYEANQILKQHSQIFQKDLPFPCIIVNIHQNQLNFLFSNQKAKEMIVSQQSSNSDVTQIFKQLEIDEQSAQNGTIINLYDFIIGISSGKNIQNYTTFLSNVEFKPNNTQHQQQQNKIQFDITLTSCYFNNQSCYLLIFKNINERLALQQLTLVNRLKNKLINSLQHNLKTPLNGLMGHMHSLKQIIDQNSYQLDKEIQYIQVCINQIYYMVCDLVDYQALENHRFELCKSEFDLLEIIKEIREMFGDQIAMKQIELNVSMEGQFNIIYNDKQRLTQIIINIIQNSVKFTFSGKIDVNITKVPQQNLIRFKISDTGIGMSEDKVKQAFNLFGIFSMTSSEDTSGIGLGLCLVQKLIGQIGEQQSLQLISTQNSGTTFVFDIYEQIQSPNTSLVFSEIEQSLEVQQQYQEEAQKFLSIRSIPSELGRNKVQIPKSIIITDKRLNQKSQIYQQKMKILVVDDTPFNIKAIESFLVKNQEFEIDKAFNGQQAYNLVVGLHQNNIDNYVLIFMDCNMPVMDGYQSTQLIKEYLRNQKLHDIPIVAVTAYAGLNEEIKCLQSGMNDFIAKPCKFNDIQRALQKWVRPSYQFT